jgi:sensor histidine kinase YesM
MCGIISFFLIDYLSPRKSRKLSFFGFPAVVWMLGLFMHFSPFFFTAEILPFETAASEIIITSVKFLFLLMMFYLGIHFNFKARFLKKVFLTICIVFINIFVEAIGLLITSGVTRDPIFDEIIDAFAPLTFPFVLLGFFILSLYLFFYPVFFNFLQKKNIEFESKNKYVVLIFFALLLFDFTIISYYILYRFRPVSHVFQTAIFVLPALVLAFYIYSTHINNKRWELKLKTKSLEQFNTAQTRYIEKIVEQNSMIVRLKHDFSTHARTISGLAEADKLDELKKYLRSYVDEYTLDPLIFCENGALNAILSSKYALAKEKGIDLQILFDDSVIGEISTFDLCSVISNLLDNAIEASEKLNSGVKKQIKISSATKANCFIIKQVNPSAEPRKDLKTTKDNPIDHGIGLKIIKDTAKKYSGSALFEFDSDEGVFTSTVIMNTSK